MILRPANRLLLLSRLSVWLCLIGCLLSCSSARRETRREFEPWRTVTESGVEWRAPERFVRRDMGQIVLYHPAGENLALPFAGVGKLEKLPPGMTVDELLAGFRPRHSDESLKMQPVTATVAGRSARGFETAGDESMGWTIVVEDAGKPRAVVLIGVPAYWKTERAHAFRDLILDSVRLP